MKQTELVHRKPFAGTLVTALVVAVIALGSIALQGCAKATPVKGKLPGNQSDEIGRTFEVNKDVDFVRVSVLGVEKGPMDAEKIEFLLRVLSDSGRIIDLRVLSRPMDGGGIFCFKFPSNANRELIFELLTSVETDQAKTSYSLLSVDACTGGATQKSIEDEAFAQESVGPE